MKKLLALVIPLSFYFNSVWANPGAWMPESKKIESIVVEGEETGKALIIINGGVPSDYIPEACRKGTDAHYNTVFLNTEKGRAIYAMALMGLASGKSVKLALSCSGTRPLITHIRIF